MYWWQIEAACAPEAECRIYLAELTGPHPTYRFARDFLPLDYYYDGKTIRSDFGIKKEGVYEESVSYRDPQTHIAQSRRRRWFCVYAGEVFDLLGYKEIEMALLGFQLKHLSESKGLGLEVSLLLNLYFDTIAKHTWLQEKVDTFDVLVTPDEADLEAV